MTGTNIGSRFHMTDSEILMELEFHEISQNRLTDGLIIIHRGFIVLISASVLAPLIDLNPSLNRLTEDLLRTNNGRLAHTYRQRDVCMCTCMCVSVCVECLRY